MLNPLENCVGNSSPCSRMEGFLKHWKTFVCTCGSLRTWNLRAMAIVWSFTSYSLSTDVEPWVSVMNAAWFFSDSCSRWMPKFHYDSTLPPMLHWVYETPVFLIRLTKSTCWRKSSLKIVTVLMLYWFTHPHVDFFQNWFLL